MTTVATPLREKIIAFEKTLKNFPDAFVGDSEKCPLKHSFADGIYVREIRIPKGMLLVGKIHKWEHPNFLMKGRAVVITEGGGKEFLKAPMSMISKAGTKRVVYAITDLIWITCHRTDETDLEKIEEQVIAKNYDELDNVLK